LITRPAGIFLDWKGYLRSALCVNLRESGAESETLQMSMRYRARRNITTLQFFEAVIGIVLLLAWMSFGGLPASGQVYSGQASILSSNYTVQEGIVALNVHIGYSYSAKQWLKISVQTYSPEEYHEKIITVGPGTNVREVIFELKPPPSLNTWTASISLYKSNEKGENLDLLHLKSLDIDIKGAEERQNQPSLGALVFIVGAGVLALVFHSKRGKRALRERRQPTKRMMVWIGSSLDPFIVALSSVCLLEHRTRDFMPVRIGRIS
jgi:hypothetical protein